MTLLFDIGLIIIVATSFSYLARLLKQPLIVAFVLAGVLIGPVGLGLISNLEDIQILAELGIAFILFTVGLEIDFKKLKHVGKAAFVGGLIQIFLTFIIGFGLANLMGFGGILAIYIGLLVSFSSTMIVTKFLIDRGEINALHGRIMIGILILQDILVILALPLLANPVSLFSLGMFSSIIIKGLGLFAVAIVLNRFIFPKLLDFAARMREILFLTAVSVVFLFVGFAYILGFPIVIGAFIAGVALGNFPYKLEIVGETRALMDFFSIIFFATLGMQLSLSVIFDMLPQFLMLMIAIMILKPVILGTIYFVQGYGGRISSNIGLGLGQASEFSFILAAQGLALGHLTGNFYSLMISVIVVSMVITPYLMKTRGSVFRFASSIEERYMRKLKIPHKVHRLGMHPKEKLTNHIIVLGAHIMGGEVTKYLERKKKKFVVVEHDPDIVKKLKERGIFVVYGDADNEELLKRIGLYRAKLVVITVPDYEIGLLVIRKLKKQNPKAKILARAYSKENLEELLKEGADFVVVPDLVGGERIIREISHILGKK